MYHNIFERYSHPIQPENDWSAGVRRVRSFGLHVPESYNWFYRVDTCKMESHYESDFQTNNACVSWEIYPDSRWIVVKAEERPNQAIAIIQGGTLTKKTMPSNKLHNKKTVVLSLKSTNKRSMNLSQEKGKNDNDTNNIFCNTVCIGACPWSLHLNFVLWHDSWRQGHKRTQEKVCHCNERQIC